jgi:quinolinate synthase
MENILDEIDELKKNKNAVILAHNYQSLSILKIADYIGDSFYLANISKNLSAKIIVFCGVLFMAETTKLINQEAKVLLSNSNAGCEMADMVDPTELEKFKIENPAHIVVCYVNSTIKVKALSDICVTSSNAVKIVNQLPKNKPILFIPDRNLGNYVKKITKRNIITWDGFCPVHNDCFTVDGVIKAKKRYPDHKIIIHPESKPEVLELADFVGSTSQLMEYAQKYKKVVIGTEIGLIDLLNSKFPDYSIKCLSENRYNIQHLPYDSQISCTK